MEVASYGDHISFKLTLSHFALSSYVFFNVQIMVRFQLYEPANEEVKVIMYIFYRYVIGNIISLGLDKEV